MWQCLVYDCVHLCLLWEKSSSQCWRIRHFCVPCAWSRPHCAQRACLWIWLQILCLSLTGIHWSQRIASEAKTVWVLAVSKRQLHWTGLCSCSCASSFQRTTRPSCICPPLLSARSRSSCRWSQCPSWWAQPLTADSFGVVPLSWTQTLLPKSGRLCTLALQSSCLHQLPRNYRYQLRLSCARCWSIVA